MTPTAPLDLAIIGSRGFPSTYGGYETLVRHLARDWTSAGHRVTVYCRSRPAGLRTWTVDGVRCIWTPGWDSNRLSTLSFGATAHVDASLRQFDAALVLNVANGFFLPILRARGIPTAVNTDGIEWERGKWGPVARRVFRKGALLTARTADVLIADSKAIAALWLQQFSVTSVFVPYGADVLTVRSADRLQPLHLAARDYVLIVARLIPENNIELILHALERIAPPVRAVVVGAAPAGARLGRTLRHYQDRGVVQCLGHIDDQALLTELWANAGVYVHGHSVGGTNPGLLQALGAGAPTIALDTVFNREVIGSDDQLFRGEPRELARKIAAVIRSPATQERFSAHGKAVVGERYRWPDISRLYLNAMLEARRRRRQNYAPRSPVGSWPADVVGRRLAQSAADSAVQLALVAVSQPLIQDMALLHRH